MTTPYLKYVRDMGYMLLALSMSATTLATTLSEAEQRITALIDQQKQPDGVVFELVSRNTQLLNTALPAIQGYISRLKQAYPDVEISVVSHGPEMLALAKDNIHANTQAHTSVQSLVSKDINVHVCGAYAEYKGISEDNFPDYVDVAAHGPELIRDYLSLGYIHIKVKTE